MFGNNDCGTSWMVTFFVIILRTMPRADPCCIRSSRHDANINVGLQVNLPILVIFLKTKCEITAGQIASFDLLIKHWYKEWNSSNPAKRVKQRLVALKMTFSADQLRQQLRITSYLVCMQFLQLQNNTFHGPIRSLPSSNSPTRPRSLEVRTCQTELYELIINRKSLWLVATNVQWSMMEEDMETDFISLVGRSLRFRPYYLWKLEDCDVNNVLLQGFIESRTQTYRLSYQYQLILRALQSRFSGWHKRMFGFTLISMYAVIQWSKSTWMLQC